MHPGTSSRRARFASGYRLFAAFACAIAALAAPLFAQGQADNIAKQPYQAMVRIHSHGASATVIASKDGKSWLLGCAHMLTDSAGRPDSKLIERVLRMDGPPQENAKAQGKANARLLAYDEKLDLSLIEIDNGPFHMIPVAPKGFKPGKNILSLGYDEMKWPVTQKSATLLGSQGNTTYTVEKPWHGRSGGALIDADSMVLIGVVQGYEVYPGNRGLYVSHDAILRFLAGVKGGPPQAMPQPQPISQQRILPPLYQQPCPT